MKNNTAIEKFIKVAIPLLLYYRVLIKYLTYY